MINTSHFEKNTSVLNCAQVRVVLRCFEERTFFRNNNHLLRRHLILLLFCFSYQLALNTGDENWPFEYFVNVKQRQLRLFGTVIVSFDNVSILRLSVGPAWPRVDSVLVY